MNADFIGVTCQGRDLAGGLCRPLWRYGSFLIYGVGAENECVVPNPVMLEGLVCPWSLLSISGDALLFWTRLPILRGDAWSWSQFRKKARRRQINAWLVEIQLDEFILRGGAVVVACNQA